MKHMTEPSKLEYVPGSHTEQSAPGALCFVPIAHGVQPSTPSGRDWPGTHVEHVPSVLSCVCGGHSSHMSIMLETRRLYLGQVRMQPWPVAVERALSPPVQRK